MKKRIFALLLVTSYVFSTVQAFGFVSFGTGIIAGRCAAKLSSYVPSYNSSQKDMIIKRIKELEKEVDKEVTVVFQWESENCTQSEKVTCKIKDIESERQKIKETYFPEIYKYRDEGIMYRERLEAQCYRPIVEIQDWEKYKKYEELLEELYKSEKVLKRNEFSFRKIFSTFFSGNMIGCFAGQTACAKDFGIKIVAPLACYAAAECIVRGYDKFFGNQKYVTVNEIKHDLTKHKNRVASLNLILAAAFIGYKNLF